MTQTRLRFFSLLMVGLLSLPALAELDVVDKRNIEALASGSMVSLKSVARQVHAAGGAKTEVLDVMAEVIWQRYPRAVTGDMDALAWGLKALGASGNNRYHGLCKDVADSGAHKKLKKYAGSCLKGVGKKPTVAQYSKGSVSLSDVNAKASKQKKAALSNAAPASTGKHKLDVVRVGMPMTEVYDLVGHPTSTNSHITGKQFKPFNFRGADTYRTTAYYQGQGRIIFSNSSHYDANWKVMEVQIDPSEDGYQ